VTAQYELPVLTADIGGSKILTAIFTGNGEIQSRNIIQTGADEGVEAVIERLVRAIGRHLEDSNLEQSNLSGINIACAGGVDSERGVVVTPSPNLPGWHDVPLRDVIEARFGVTTTVLNDASAAALGEHRYGVGKGVNNLVFISLGTGIGGGIIVDGHLYQGASGAAGELGHMTIDANGPTCGCGNIGCLEMFASGKAIVREAIKRIRDGRKSSLTEVVDGKTEDITVETIAAAAKGGDSLALEVLARASHYLGVGLVNMVNIFNPEMIIIGGGMADIGGLLLEPAREMVKKRAFGISARAVNIVTAGLGNEAGIYGAVAYAREQKIRRTA